MEARVMSAEMSFVGPPHATDDDFESFIHATVTELEKLGQDVVVSARLADREAEFTAIVADDGQFAFLIALRTALHAAGCNTAKWPNFAVREQEVRELATA